MSKLGIEEVPKNVGKDATEFKFPIIYTFKNLFKILNFFFVYKVFK